MRAEASTLARPTALALAFIDAAASPKAEKHGRCSVLLAADRNSGLVRERAVDVRCSFRTAQVLKKQEVL